MLSLTTIPKKCWKTSMSNLPVEQTWMVLVELLTDLRKRGVEIDPSIPEDIRMAKTTINFYKVNPADPERMKEVKRINDFLTSPRINSWIWPKLRGTNTGPSG